MHTTPLYSQLKWRQEAFGGMVMTPDLRVFFVADDVIAALDRGANDPVTRRFTAALRTGADPDNDQDLFLNQLQLPTGFDCLSVPAVVHLMLTRACNLHCDHCATDAGSCSDELTTDRWCALIDELGQAGVFALTLTGGEPLCHPDVDVILERAASSNVPVTILTNGTLVTERWLSSLPGNVSFLVSVDALHEQADHVLRDKVRRAITMMGEYDRPVLVTCMYTRMNKQEVNAIMDEFMFGQNISVIPTPVLPLGRAMCHPELLLTADDAADFVAAKTRKFQYYRNPSVRRRLSFGLDDLTEVFESALWACSGTRVDLAVRWDGIVFPCINCLCTDQFAIGDLRQETIHDIWKPNKAAAEFRSIRWEQFLGCKNCDIESYCNFRCPPLSLQKNGIITGCGADQFTAAVIRLGMKRQLTDRIDAGEGR